MNTTTVPPLELFRQLQAVLPGHLDIEEHDIRDETCDRGLRATPSPHSDTDRHIRSQRSSDRHLSRQRLVVDDEDPKRRHQRPLRGR